MERNANLVKRYWSWELVWLVYSIANSLSVSYIGLGMVMIAGAQKADGQYLVLYLVVGTLVWRYLSIIFYWITDVIGMERWEGTIEYTLMAPIRRVTHMAGQTIFAVLYSLVFTGIILAVTVFLFKRDLKLRQYVGGTPNAPSRQLFFHRIQHNGIHTASAVSRTRFSDDTCDHCAAPAGIRCVLSRRSAARFAANAVQV